MAIYTQYGRYLKAKMMKEALSSNDSDTYMVFGLGNPQWDVPDSNQEITIASYNTYSLRNPGATENQFYDENIWQTFNDPDTTNFEASQYSVVRSGNALQPWSFINKCTYLIPTFPAYWKDNTNNVIITLSNGNDPNVLVKQNDYQFCYIVKNANSNQFDFCGRIENDSHTRNIVELSNVSVPSSDIEKQYFAEMYLRGMSIVRNGFVSPVGLLGAIKCEVSLVRELGGVENYTGNIHQFYYGDRYWEIADNSSVDIDKDNQNFPTHLFISTLVNPRYLCSDLNIDLNAVPRHIAIYTKKRKYDPTYNNDQGRYIPGENYYRVGDTTHPYAFNFGQYYWNSDINKWESIYDRLLNLSTTNIINNSNNLLNFTLPCTTDYGNYDYKNPDNEYDFKFILNDYIHGTPRQSHVADRFGYVVGF